MFRLNVGLSSSATPCGGWESPTTELRGHSTGHVLTALAQAYASTGDTAFRTKGDYDRHRAGQCQARAATAGFNTGYLSRVPGELHRPGRGAAVGVGAVLHAPQDHGRAARHAPAGRQRPGARPCCTGMAAWVKFRNDRLTQTQRQNMLDTEFGGMNEVLANLYQLTGDPNHLTAAQHFDHAEIFDPLAAEHRQPEQLPRQHADPEGDRRDPRVPRHRHDPVPRHRRRTSGTS